MSKHQRADAWTVRSNQTATSSRLQSLDTPSVFFITVGWLLARIEANPAAWLDHLSRTSGIGRPGLGWARAELRKHGLVAEIVAPGIEAHTCEVTRTDQEGVTRRRAAMRAQLSDRLADWAPERREDVANLLGRLARELMAQGAPPARHPQVRVA